MIKNILKTLQDTGDIMMDKAAEINEAAKEKFQDAKDHTKEKMMSVIEEWVELLPKLTAMGFEMTSFGVAMSISPCMLLEMKTHTARFSEERIRVLIEENKNEKSIKLLLGIIKTTLQLHKKSKATIKEDLIVKIEVKLSPEIKVFIGKPELL
ncbi:MAG: hypothetical protein WAU01_09465 [Saprospiraceae bacterium]